MAHKKLSDEELADVTGGGFRLYNDGVYDEETQCTLTCGKYGRSFGATFMAGGCCSDFEYRNGVTWPQQWCYYCAHLQWKATPGRK